MGEGGGGGAFFKDRSSFCGKHKKRTAAVRGKKQWGKNNPEHIICIFQCLRHGTGVPRAMRRSVATGRGGGGGVSLTVLVRRFAAR